jgi:hypothetical protein
MTEPLTLVGVNIICNYPNEEMEVDCATEMSVGQLYLAIGRLLQQDKDLTSFIITAAIKRNP